MFSYKLPVTTVEENWKGVTGVNNLGWGRVVACIVVWRWSTWLTTSSVCEKYLQIFSAITSHISDNQIFSEFLERPVCRQHLLHRLCLQRANFRKNHEKCTIFLEFSALQTCRYCWLKLPIAELNMLSEDATSNTSKLVHILSDSTYSCTQWQ
jgi:hypothetical protein